MNTQHHVGAQLRAVSASVANNIAHKSNRHVADNFTKNPHADILRVQWLQQYLPIAAKYGDDPGTVAQAAAHEAGHVLVSLALDPDATFIRARLHRNPDATWGGYSEVWCPSIHLTERKTFMPSREPDRAGALMVIQAAGIVGEMVAGHWHPASSLDEVMMVRGVAEEAGINPVSIILAAHTSIRRNQVIFDTLRGVLARQRRLLKSDVARATRNLVSVEVAA